VQVEPGIDVAEVVAGEFSDARQPVTPRIAREAAARVGADRAGRLPPPRRSHRRIGHPVRRFRAAVRAVGYSISRLSALLIGKYIADLRELQVL
jgi:hypothetical protein